MSVTVTQQLTQQTVTVTGNPVENNVTVTVSNARGPAGQTRSPLRRLPPPSPAISSATAPPSPVLRLRPTTRRQARWCGGMLTVARISRAPSTWPSGSSPISGLRITKPQLTRPFYTTEPAHRITASPSAQARPARRCLARRMLRLPMPSSTSLKLRQRTTIELLRLTQTTVNFLYPLRLVHGWSICACFGVLLAEQTLLTVCNLPE